MKNRILTVLLAIAALFAPPVAVGQVTKATGGGTATVAATFTRPADTTAYAANDVVANSTTAPTVLTFANACRLAGGAGYITKLRGVTDQSTNLAQYRLWFYTTAPTAINDNAPFTLLWANRTSRIGSVDVGPFATEGTGSDAAAAQNTEIRLPFVCAAGSTALSAIVETKTAFTPASGQNFYFQIAVEQH